MSDPVSAQAFRDTASVLSKEATCHRQVENVWQATQLERAVALLLAAAEQREQADRVTVERDAFHTLSIERRAQIETLETERDKALATLAKMQPRDVASERDLLRAALVGLVGVDTPEELDAMEALFRAATIPAEDKAATIDAIHALRRTER